MPSKTTMESHWPLVVSVLDSRAILVTAASIVVPVLLDARPARLRRWLRPGPRSRQSRSSTWLIMVGKPSCRLKLHRVGWNLWKHSVYICNWILLLEYVDGFFDHIHPYTTKKSRIWHRVCQKVGCLWDSIQAFACNVFSKTVPTHLFKCHVCCWAFQVLTYHLWDQKLAGLHQSH